MTYLKTKKRLRYAVPAALALFAVACAKAPGIDAHQTGNLSNKSRLLASPVGDVVGKTIVGYQGWFAAAGDGQPGGKNWWWHWTENWNALPSNNDKALWAWPDVRDYDKTYQTGYPALNNGNPAKLYSCVDQQTVTMQFQWMQENGIDGAALQRFNPTGEEGPLRDRAAQNVRTAAEATGRKFYIMYDATDWVNMQMEMKNDWTSKMKGFTSSNAYARQNGKPVVAIWGFGYDDNHHPWTAAVCLDVVNWFKAQGCYVIGGVPREWRFASGDRASFANVYKAFDMLSPWLVGAVNNVGDADRIYNDFIVGDAAYCKANQIDYQPCVLPGGLGQRAHGDLMWRMFYNAIRAGSQGLYISMYDEYNEGNQIAKTAPTKAWLPAGSRYEALDNDGVFCTSDYYLRLTRDGNRMLKGMIPLTALRPTIPGIDYIETCDQLTGWSSANALSVVTNGRKQGDGFLRSTGSGTDDFSKVITPALNSGATPATGRLQFWYYVSDVTRLSGEDQIEIGSGGGPDRDEYSWSIGPLTNGWNLISKPLSAAVRTGNPNLNAINWLRVYHYKNGSVTTGLDGIQIIP